MTCLQSMKTTFLTKWSAALAFVVFSTVFVGCTDVSSGGGKSDPCGHVKYGGKEMERYADSAHMLAICIPKGLTKKGPAGFPDGRVVFSGFAVPAGTNLTSKTFVIVDGAYPDVQGDTPAGQLTAGGVTFKRTKFYDGHAGHIDLHVMYTATVGGKTLHLDFVHFSVNPGVFDPGNRPAVYDEAAQIKLTEVIMGTFRKLP